MPRLSPAQLAHLASGARREWIARRTVVPLGAREVTIVTSAWFRVFRRTAYVRDATLFLAQPGDVLAAGVLFGERSAESGAQAIADGSLLRLEPRAFEDLARSEPELYVSVAANLGDRILRLEHKVESLGRSDVEARVAEVLLEIADDFGRPVDGGTRLDLPLTQEDLAALAGTSRPSVSQAVAAFARAGWVVGSRLRGLVIADRVALGALLR